MKLSEYKNEEALDLLAEIIEPCAKIMADKQLQKLIKGKSKLDIVKAIIKSHKSEIIEILATLDGVPVNEYQCNVFTLPLKIIELLNDEELISFFTSQGLMEGSIPSIAPTANTEAKEQ